MDVPEPWPGHKSPTLHCNSGQFLSFRWAGHGNGSVRQTGRMPQHDESFPEIGAGDRCPCGTGLAFGECCARFLSGELQAPTAQRLMRSRYTAFVVGDVPYLLATWHPSTRPAALELDPGISWRSLEIVRSERGGPLDREGVVEFSARYRADGERGVQREVSRFVRDDRWRYVEAIG